MLLASVGNSGLKQDLESLVVIDVLSGAITELTDHRWDRFESFAWKPAMDGIIFSADENGGGNGAYTLWEISYPDGRWRQLNSGFSNYDNFSLTADGRVLIARETTITSAVSVSPDSNAANAKEVSTVKDTASRGVAWTPDKRLVVISTTSGRPDLWIMNADGSDRRQLTTDGNIKFNPVVSPDGRHIVFETSEGRDIWRINIDGGNPTRMTRDGVDATNPDISPDGKWLVYSAIIAGQENLWRVAIEGGEAVKLTDFFYREPDVSPDGHSIACFFLDETRTWHLRIVPFAGGAPTHTFAVPHTVHVHRGVKWMPDGQGLVYINGRGGVENLWLQPITGGPPNRLPISKTTASRVLTGRATANGLPSSAKP